MESIGTRAELVRFYATAVRGFKAISKKFAEEFRSSWTFRANSPAPQAAGTIHGDFEDKFIRAEVISYDDYVAGGSESAARDTGKQRTEGKDYIVQDGDVMHIRHGA